jgi:hypothetical protein
MLLQKVHIENSPQKIDKNFDVSFPRFFGFSCVFGCFSAISDENSKALDTRHYKKRLTKNRVEKFSQENRQKNPKPIFSRFFLSRFWAFLGEGSSKTRQVTPSNAIKQKKSRTN